MALKESQTVKLGGAVRPDFPILQVSARGKPLVYLDNAATSQKPQAVIDAVDAYWTEANANVHRGVHFLSERATQRFEAARETVKRFLNARESSEVIFTKGCTEGINLVATGLERHAAGLSSTSTKGRRLADNPLPIIAAGDVILLSGMEHHSNIVPWQILAAQTGAQIKSIPITDDGEVDLDAFEKLLQDNLVRVLGIVHVSNSIGTVNPVKHMIRRARAKGAITLVDGAQGGPHSFLDVQELDADFYTLSCHKIYAPTGVGVLYGKRPLLEALPAYQGGGSMIRTVSFEESTYAEIPSKFEPGTPNMAGVIGLGAAIEYLESLAPESTEPRGRLRAVFDAIHRHDQDLVHYANSLLAEIPGLRLIGTAPDKAGIVSFVLLGAHPHDMGSLLDADGIAVRAGHHCCMPLMKRFGVPATTRASFAIYNTREEVEALAMGVKGVRNLFS